MIKNNSILLISNNEESHWFRVVVNLLISLGKLDVLHQRHAMESISRQNYDLIVIDARAVDNDALVVSRIHVTQPDSRIVVITPTPTWRRARCVLLSGAMDYIGITMSEREFLAVFKDVLTITPQLVSQVDLRRSQNENHPFCRQ
jgi:DNA-binding NtrC family response regulator